MHVEFVVGFDPRERFGWGVCVKSILKHSKIPYAIRPISTTHLGDIYKRPTERRDGRLWDVISGAFCATEFSISRFFTPLDSKYQWSIFMDGDFLVRHDVEDLIGQLDPKYALMCVKHDYRPHEEVKMDGQLQTQYERKNWSSLMAFNNKHAGTQRLLHSGYLNQAKGLFLHQLKWLGEYEIGEIDPAWNWLEGTEEPEVVKACHFTRGTPDMGYDGKYAREWWAYS